MRAVVQRVSEAFVEVEGEVVGREGGRVRLLSRRFDRSGPEPG